MLGYLSVDVICSEKRTVFRERQLRGTDNVQGQISGHIFAPNGGYCLYYPSNLFRSARNFENWGIFNNYSPRWKWLKVDIYRAAKRRGNYPREKSKFVFNNDLFSDVKFAVQKAAQGETE